MELSEINTPSGTQPVDVDDQPSLEASSVNPTVIAPPPQMGGSIAATNASTTPAYIYSIGSIAIRYPRPSVEKEFAQVISRTETTGLSDSQAMHKVLAQRDNRYLARQLCWVQTVEGLETYILLPRDPADFELLVEAVRPRPGPLDIDVVIGVKGPIASSDLCNGLMVPIVAFDQIYSFDRDSLIKSIPRPEPIPAEEFAAAAEEVFDRIQQLADNAGATDEHRALNYLAVRDPAIYKTTAEAHGRNCSLTAVEVVQSRLSAVRKVVTVVFTYTNRATDVQEKYFLRVDVTEEFPFLVTKLSPYFDR
jgi:hypothetical protein